MGWLAPGYGWEKCHFVTVRNRPIEAGVLLVDGDQHFFVGDSPLTAFQASRAVVIPSASTIMVAWPMRSRKLAKNRTLMVMGAGSIHRQTLPFTVL